MPKPDRTFTTVKLGEEAVKTVAACRGDHFFGGAG